MEVRKARAAVEAMEVALVGPMVSGTFPSLPMTCCSWKKLG